MIFKYLYGYKLCHLKDAIIKELQKKLKNHYRAVGKQVFSLHCSENAFVGLFGTYIMCYSPCGSFYSCNFKEENAVETVGSIFNNNNWYKHNYGNGQLSFVRLYISEEQDISKKNNETYCSNENSKPPKKSKSKLFLNDEMIIE
ncbi:39189_t:CDS:2 [Gigaspora margarita]|uniref:39189_t:CDS:1 n=1 Tax=Gigaspora margarita TaxID=4874 RepID=A0ABN7WMH5_GIGMA|nr:39189_t:CDS:2 [Gigaspora margarita]